MFLGLFSGQRSVAGGFRLLGFNLVERRGLRSVSEACGKLCKVVGFMVFLEFGHVWYYQFWLNSLHQVLSRNNLGGSSSMTQFVVDIPLQLIEVRENRSKENLERRAASLMEDDFGSAVLLLQAKILCVYFHWDRSTLKSPELEAPL